MGVIELVGVPFDGWGRLDDQAAAATVLRETGLAEAVAAVGEGGCLGWSISIYDPEQDPDRTDATRILQMVAEVIGAMVTR